jgi:hypothetical protein
LRSASRRRRRRRRRRRERAGLAVGARCCCVGSPVTSFFLNFWFLVGAMSPCAKKQQTHASFRPPPLCRSFSLSLPLFLVSPRPPTVSLQRHARFCHQSLQELSRHLSPFDVSFLSFVCDVWITPV